MLQTIPCGEISLPLDLADFHPVTKSVTDWHRWWKSVKSVEILIPGIKRNRCIIHMAVWKPNLLRCGKFHTDWQQWGKSNHSHCWRESFRNSQNLWTFAIYSRNEWESSNAMVKGWCNVKVKGQPSISEMIGHFNTYQWAEGHQRKAIR